MGLTFKMDWQYGGYIGRTDHAFDWDTSGESDEKVFRDKSYWLFEGNGDCDCNRAEWLLAPFPWRCPDSHRRGPAGFEWGCGRDIIFNHVEFWRDGRLIGYGSDERNGYGDQLVRSPVITPTILEQAIILRG